MNRLHVDLRKAGIDSNIICEKKTTDSPFVTLIPPPLRFESKIKAITSRLGLNDIHRLSSFRMKHHDAFKKADILHFHGTHSGFFNYLAMSTLSNIKPSVFTLHDMWAITGHCAYSFDCDRWRIGCGKCPYPDVHPEIKRDGTKIEWKLKNWTYGKSNISFISPSKWMTTLAQQSMINSHPIYTIPHGVDTACFKPIDKNVCRSRLKIPANKKVLIFLSVSLNDPRKGGDLLINALKQIPVHLKKNLFLLVLGHEGERIVESSGISTLNLGYVSSDQLKAVAYSAADLLIFPTRADVFGLISIESQACGTPVVSFRVNAVPEHVRHGITGYLAERENSFSLCKSIVQLLVNDNLRIEMGENCRKIALDEYRSELMVQRHVDLYRRLLNQPLCFDR